MTTTKDRTYNGFTAEQRGRGGRLQNKAWREGSLQRPSRCHVCNQGGTVLAHLEDYDAFRDYFAMCLGCHKALHFRHKSPELYAAWLAMLEAGDRPRRFTGYHFLLWHKLYEDLPVHKWPKEPSDREPNLTLMRLVSMEPVSYLPKVFDRTNGSPLLSGQHDGGRDLRAWRAR